MYVMSIAHTWLGRVISSPPPPLAAARSKQAAKPPRPGERELQMQRVDPAHQIEVGRRHRARQVVHRAARDADHLGLLRVRQLVTTVDHRFAFSNPALLSAPSKKSFSKVSSPILACRAFTSTGGGDCAVPPPGPNTSAAQPSSCAFQVVIWFG